jgi:hypothetical protein
MLDAQGTSQAEEDDPEPIGLSPGKLKRLANLRPAWTSESAPRHGGLAKDGGGTKDHPLRAQLRKRLAKRRALVRFVDTWIEDACNGDAQAREQILKRLDPVLDDPSQGKQVLEGLKLELTHRGATLTVARATPAQELPAHDPSGVPEGGLDAPDIRLEGVKESHLLPESRVSGTGEFLREDQK